MTQALHIFVDRGVLLDEGIGLSNIGFRLVVVVIADKVFNGIIGQQLSQLISQLSSKGLIMRHHQGGALLLLNQPGRSS